MRNIEEREKKPEAELISMLMGKEIRVLKLQSSKQIRRREERDRETESY